MPNERLRRAMVRAGHSIESLADAAGYHPKQVTRWVAQGSVPRRRDAKATVARLLGVDPYDIWPEGNPFRLRALQSRYEAATEPDPGTMDDVDRRELLRGSAALGMMTSTAPVSATSTMLDAPGRVGAADLAELRTARNRFRGISFSHGGGNIALNDAITLLRGAACLLEGQCHDRVRPALCSTLGALANTVGFAAFDAGRHDDARRILRFALACAEEANDWGLRARTLAADLAPVQLWTGQPEEALTLVELAQVRSDRLTATEQAMTWAARARAYAHLHDRDATRHAVGRADEAFDQAQPGESPEMRWYTAAEHDAATGQALGDLALATGRHDDEAITRLRSAITGFNDDYARSRVHAQAQLATLLMALGDPSEAVAVADDLLPAVPSVRSQRTRGLLAELHDVAINHATRPDVADLRGRLEDVA